MNAETPNDNTQTVDNSRRAFVRTAAYAAPVILTMKAMPAMANTGSNRADSQAPTASGPGISTPSSGSSVPSTGSSTPSTGSTGSTGSAGQTPQTWQPGRDASYWQVFWRNLWRSIFSWR